MQRNRMLLLEQNFAPHQREGEMQENINNEGEDSQNFSHQRSEYNFVTKEALMRMLVQIPWLEGEFKSFNNILKSQWWKEIPRD